MITRVIEAAQQVLCWQPLTRYKSAPPRDKRDLRDIRDNRDERDERDERDIRDVAIGVDAIHCCPRHPLCLFSLLSLLCLLTLSPPHFFSKNIKKIFSPKKKSFMAMLIFLAKHAEN